MLAMATSIQQPLFAEKKHSSSSSNKDDKCCKESKKLLKQINQTTVQDLVVDQTTLNVANQINQTTRADLVVDQETLDIVKHLQDCSCICTVIMPQDFADSDGNLSQTYVITEPGSYCLGADVAFSPIDEFTPAINILANDVRLDLRGFTLSQDPESGTPNTYGVQIGQGYNYDDPDAVLKNITITNGSIINFTAIGLFCYNGSFDGPTAEVAFESLTFTGLNILDCGSSPSFDFASGIDLDSAANQSLYLDPPVAFKNVIIENCNVNRCVGNAAIQVFTVDNLVVGNTQANDLSSQATVFYTFAHSYVGRNIKIFGCQGNGVTDSDPVFRRRQCGGLLLSDSVNINIKNSQFNDAFGESIYLVNSNLSVNQNMVVENCQFNNSRGGKLAVAVTGVHMSESTFPEVIGADGYRFINCQFNGHRIDPLTPAYPRHEANLVVGLLVTSLRNLVCENCQACNIIAENDNFWAAGFAIGTESDTLITPYSDGLNWTLKNCIVSDIHTTSTWQNAAGFELDALDQSTDGVQGAQWNIVVENCIAERISSATNTSTVAGIKVGLLHTFPFPPQNQAINPGPYPAIFNVFIAGNRVSDVRSTAEDTTPLSAGILMQAVHRPDICRNSVSDCDRGILLTGTDKIIPNWFQLAATVDDALAFPPVFIDLNTIPASAPVEDFFNNTQGNSVSIAPSSITIDVKHNFIVPSDDLTALGWQPGDAVSYDCNGGSPIANLVCGTTYYAIVYIPSFSEKGLIQNNKIDNCSISCYQDDAPTTLSAWVNNTAFNCGTCPQNCPTQFTNYDIDFAGVRPVDAGSLVSYPVGGNKYYNLSLVP